MLKEWYYLSPSTGRVAFVRLARYLEKSLTTLSVRSPVDWSVFFSSLGTLQSPTVCKIFLSLLFLRLEDSGDHVLHTGH